MPVMQALLFDFGIARRIGEWRHNQPSRAPMTVSPEGRGDGIATGTLFPSALLGVAGWPDLAERGSSKARENWVRFAQALQ
jgi:hypothetical protein